MFHNAVVSFFSNQRQFILKNYKNKDNYGGYFSSLGVEPMQKQKQKTHFNALHDKICYIGVCVFFSYLLACS